MKSTEFCTALKKICNEHEMARNGLNSNFENIRIGFNEARYTVQQFENAKMRFREECENLKSATRVKNLKLLQEFEKAVDMKFMPKTESLHPDRELFEKGLITSQAQFETLEAKHYFNPTMSAMLYNYANQKGFTTREAQKPTADTIKNHAAQTQTIWSHRANEKTANVDSGYWDQFTEHPQYFEKFENNESFKFFDSIE